MSRIHLRLRAFALLILLFPLWWLQRTEASPMAADRVTQGTSSEKPRPGGDDASRPGDTNLPDEDDGDDDDGKDKDDDDDDDGDDDDDDDGDDDDGDDDDGDDDDGDDDCTRTQGYWKNHNRYADNPSQNIPWPIDEDTLLCGETWYDILHTPPQGDAWIILAHQWIAAMLNEASGADTDVLNGALDDAEDLLSGNCDGLDSEETDDALDLAELLDDYNNGRIGPPHCGDGDDCNENGIDDSIDIEAGTSADRDDNGIPDECEFFIIPECIGSGTENGGVDCPCGNEVPPGEVSGCENSTGQGASLTATGLPLVSNDTLVLTASGIPTGKVSFFLYGSVNISSGVPFGDGTRCIGSPFSRVRKVPSSTGSDTFPAPNTLPISQQLGITAGQLTIWQVIYRDGFGPCMNGGNATNSLVILWGP